MSKPENPPAFPVKVRRNTSSDPFATQREFQLEGMSLRDWFAGQALAGLLTAHHTAISYPVTDEFTATAALVAGQFADAMLSEREKSLSHSEGEA